MKGKWWIVAVYLAIFGIGIGPLMVALTAGSIAEANGCELHEGFVNSCVVNGWDIGESLYTMGVLGWMTLATLPLALVLAIIFTAILVAIWVFNRQHQVSPV